MGSRKSGKDISAIWSIVGENLYDMADLKRMWLFSGWFQVMSVVSWLVPDSSWVASSGYRWFRSFQVVPRFSKYIGVFMKKV